MQVVSLSPTADGLGLLPSHQCGVNETGINPRSGVTEPRFARCAGARAPWLLRECGALSVMACLPPHCWTVPKHCMWRQHPQGRPRLYGGGGGRDLPAGVHQGSFSHGFPSKQGLALAVLAMDGQPIRDLWEAGRQTAPLRERFQGACAHASRVHGPCCQGSGQLEGCPAGHPGTRARPSGPRRAAAAAHHVDCVGVWERARLAGGNGPRGTLHPRSWGHRADHGRVFRRRADVSQTVAYARGDHASRPWRHRPRRGRGGGCAVGTDAVITFPANTLGSSLPHNGRRAGVHSSDDASRWPSCRTPAARRWRGGSPHRASSMPVPLCGRHATVSEASPYSEQGDGAEAP
jgi:AcrR family transcriptional regulator